MKLVARVKVERKGSMESSRLDHSKGHSPETGMGDWITTTSKKYP